MLQKSVAVYCLLNLTMTIGILMYLISNCTQMGVLWTVLLAAVKELVSGGVFAVLKRNASCKPAFGLLGSTVKVHGKGIIEFYLIGIPSSLIAFYGISVLYGAPLMEQYEKTFYFSCLMSCLTVLPLGVLMLNKYSYIPELILQKRPEGLVEWCALYITLCTLLGAWFGAFPIPLDWDRSWQEWPITCCFGGLMGHALGHLVCLISCSKQHGKIKKKHFN